MFCGKCGNQITAENVKFCPVCGNAVKAGPVPVQPVQSIQLVKQEYVTNDIAGNPGKRSSKKSGEKLTAGTLTLNKIIAAVAAVLLFWDLYLPFIGYSNLISFSMIDIFVENGEEEFMRGYIAYVGIFLLIYLVFQIFNLRKLSIIACIPEWLTLVLWLGYLDDINRSYFTISYKYGFALYITALILLLVPVFIKPQRLIQK